MHRDESMPGLGIEPMALNLFYLIDFYVFICNKQAAGVLVAMRECDFILCNMDYIGFIKYIVGGVYLMWNRYFFLRKVGGVKTEITLTFCLCLSFIFL